MRNKFLSFFPGYFKAQFRENPLGFVFDRWKRQSLEPPAALAAAPPQRKLKTEFDEPSTPNCRNSRNPKP